MLKVTGLTFALLSMLVAAQAAMRVERRGPTSVSAVAAATAGLGGAISLEVWIGDRQ